MRAFNYRKIIKNPAQVMSTRLKIAIAIMLVWSVWVYPLHAAIVYSYDSLSRMVRVDYGNGTVISYTYDSAGNRLSLVSNNTLDSVGDGIPDWWRAQYFGGDGTATNSQSCATCDPDGDGIANLQEYQNGSNPQVSTPPVASFSASPNTGVVPLAVTFTDASMGTITNRSWSFGDGGTTNISGTSIAHTYLAAGAKTVTLVVRGPFGNGSNTQVNLVIVVNPPQLVVSPTNCNFGGVALGQTNTLPFSVINTGGMPLNGTASVGGPFAITNGSPYNVLAGQTGAVMVSYQPLAVGSVTNQVIFNSNGGQSTNQVTGLGLNPGLMSVSPLTNFFGNLATGTTAQVSFTVTNSGGATLNGSASVAAPFAVVAGSPFTVASGSTTNVMVSFTPSSVGSFATNILFTSTANNTTNYVTGAGAIMPIAGFFANPTNGAAPLNVNFTDTSTGTITNRFWDFGDGGVTNTIATNVVYQYAVVGAYPVKLVVSGPVGSSTNLRSGLITALPVPTVTISVVAGPGGTVSGSGIYTVGSNPQISATASNGWTFIGWSNGSTNNPYTITVPATNFTFTANFAQPKQINVPTDYSTIQAAVNAANPGDTINILSGRYNEGLTINKTVNLIGSGMTNCAVYYTNTTPVVSITGPGTVRLSNFEIIGGQYVFLGGTNYYYNGTTAQGIVATNVTLVLNNVVLNQIRNYFVTLNTGYLYASNVTLFTRLIYGQCDVGFELSGCTGSVYNLVQDAGQIDHTIDNYNLPSASSQLTIDHCRIHASQLTWGNCVRTYSTSQITITNCVFYRNYEMPATNYPGLSHDGIGMNGYSNYIMITGNTFSNLPWAIGYYGSPGAGYGGNQVIVEHNTIIDSSTGGIAVQGQQYEGLDLGGGRWGSHGMNIFSQSRTDVTGYVDVYMVTNPGAAFSSSNVWAISNCWSVANPDDRILDQLDVPSLGRVFSSPTLCSNIASFTASSTNGVAPFSVTFTDTSTGGITNRYWDFGNGTTTNTSGTTVTNTYGAGTYSVQLIVSGPLNSSTNNQPNYIVVTHAPPLITQAPQATNVCTGGSALFSVAVTGGGVLTYQWQTNSVNLSNGGIYSGATSNVLMVAAVDVTTATSYRCIISNDGGSVTSTVAGLTVTAVSVGGAATPGAGAVCSGSGTSITLAGQTGTILNWQSSPDNSAWSDLGSTANPYGTGNLTAMTYFRAVVQNSPCTVAYSTAAQVTVNPVVTPAVSVSANPGTTICAGTAVTFTATPVNGGSTPSYVWKKNSVIVGGSGNSYTDSGLANGDTIDCQLTSNAGCAAPTTAIASQLLMTVNAAPSLSVAPTNLTVCAGAAVSWTAAATGSPAPAIQWQVSSNGGGTWNTITGATNSTYGFTAGIGNNGNQYQALLSNTCGVVAAGPATLTVSVGQLGVSPAAWDFGAVATGATVQASLTVTNLGCGQLNGIITSAVPFVIVAGNSFTLPGFGSTNVVISFTPSNESWYTNAVLVMSDGGVATNRLTGQGAIIPTALFSGSPTNGVVALPVVFTDQSTGTITNRYWDFGDFGTTNTTATNVVHQYTTARTNTVTLIVSGPLGASTNMLSNYIVVTNPVPPVARFSGSPTTGTGSLTVTFTDSSTGPITNRFWTFGDGKTTNTTAISIGHTYATVGTYSVALTVSGPSGASTTNRASYIVVSASSSGGGGGGSGGGSSGGGGGGGGSPQTATITVQADPSNGGTVTGGNSYTVGTSQQIVATVNPSWQFVSWSDGSPDATHTITVTAGGATYTATFQQLATITVEASPSGGGTVTGTATYVVGTTQPISAAANPGWRFTGWSDGSLVAIRTIVVPAGGATYTANFTQLATINVLASPLSGGTASGSGTYTVGTNVVISALANSSGWVFTGWNDGSTNATRTVNVPAAGATYTANFAPATVTVTVQATPDVGGTVSGSGSVSYGSNVTVCATANPCYSFVNWTDGGTIVSPAACYPFAAVASRTLVANFASSDYTITASAAPPEGGILSGGGTAPCGSNVTVVATTTNGYSFVNWTEGDAVVSPLAEYTFTAFGDRILVANFTDRLTILTSSPLPSGTVGLVYSQQFQAVSGPLPYKWSVASGALPAGLKLNVLSGGLTGSPIAAGTNDFRIQVTDAAATIATNDFRVVIVDVFGPLAGTYTGLIIDTNAPAAASSGFIQLVLSKTGAVAGNLTLAGDKTSFKSQLDRAGYAINTVAGATVALHLDVTGDTGQIDGTVTGSGYAAVLLAELPDTSRAWQGTYTLVFSHADESDPTVPQGYGYATLVVSRTGSGNLNGVLNDGTTLTARAPVSQSGQWPLYASLYRKAGVCIGWVSFETNTTLSGVVDWFAPASKGYAAFSTVLTLDGSQYTSGPQFTNGTWHVTLNGGGLGSNLVKAVAMTVAGRVTVSPIGADALKLTLTLRNGQITGSFKPKAGSKAIPFNGLLLQSQDAGAGLFQTTTGGPTGGITLEPTP